MENRPFGLKIHLLTGKEGRPGVKEKNDSYEPQDSSWDGEVRIDVGHVEDSDRYEYRPFNGIYEGHDQRII